MNNAKQNNRNINPAQPAQPQPQPQAAQATEGVYEGKPYLELPTGSQRWQFRFGPAKAKLILQHLEAIRAFADKYGNGKK
jgi:hypothetical protein